MDLVTSNNLPAKLTSFIGRERDLTAVEDLLSFARLITLTGVGGAGKTRLSLQLARRVRQNFPDGVYFVDLVPLRQPELLPKLVADTLGLHLSADQPVLEALLNFVRTKELLIILDNCEHLLPACAALAHDLLLHSDELRLLATSREPLGIPGESLYPLHGLRLPENGTSKLALPQDLLQYDAVRLFVERARLHSPEINLTTANTSTVVNICRRLDGLPLAIELASARASVLTIEEIASRPDRKCPPRT